MLELQHAAAQLDVPFSSLEFAFQQAGPGQAGMEERADPQLLRCERAGATSGIPRDASNPNNARSGHKTAPRRLMLYLLCGIDSPGASFESLSSWQTPIPNGFSGLLFSASLLT